MIDLYRSIVFDCDGVLLDSNRLKTEAFRRAALPYGADAANRLVEYHRRYGGISRYVKFEHFLSSMVAPGTAGPGLNELLASYASHVREGLLSCRAAEGLAELRLRTPSARWLVVSGGDQAELREVFAARGLETMFDGGIYGSPDSKDAIIEREIRAGALRLPALFLGDSRHDLEVARRHGIEFVFVHAWTEVEEWEALTASAGVASIAGVHELVSARRDVKQD
jgi:phosphoglycolate phosphatase-like HAD superfamily hydrolase